MNENELKNGSVENNSYQKSSKAEKILAIKRALQTGNMNAEERLSDIISDIAPNDSDDRIGDEQNFENEWEREIAERIARRFNQNKDSKILLNDILSENLPVDNKKIKPISHENFETAKENPFDFQKNMQESGKTVYDNIAAAELSNTAESEKQEEIPVKKKKGIKKFFIDLFPHKKDTLKERIRKIVFLGAVAAFFICGYIVLDYYIDNAHTKQVYEDLMESYSGISEYEPQTEPDADEEYWPLLEGAEALLKVNSDVVGVINIPDTDIFYPVLQADNNEKYLDRNIAGEEAKAGAIFMDYRNYFDRVVDGHLENDNSQNLIIYGHNMANGMMFGNLKNYKNYYYFYGEHPIIELNSNYKRYKYKIFSFFIADADDKTDTRYEYWNKLDFDDAEDFYSFVNEAKRRTIRLNDVDVKYGDQLLTLSTCDSIFGQGEGGRFVVMARMVRDGEDLYEGTQESKENPNIKWPSVYYKYNGNAKYDPDAEFVPYG